MARRKNGASAEAAFDDYRHDTKRKNNPPASIAAEGKIPAAPKLTYSYSPRLDPKLRFDDTGRADRFPELLETARTRALTADEAQVLAEALRAHQPWLEWAGKREARGFSVDPVALYIHERVSTEALLRVAARQDVTRDLFADPQQEYRQAVQFYQHDVDWSNRLILGDSLQVMASLAQREDLAGKVQMVFVDPPYGIRFASNFQPETHNRTVGDRESDLTREPEVIRAYRDTWRLGLHSYLAYLHQRLLLIRQMLAPTGSIFVQIGDENLHRVRELMDEVFGRECAIVTIVIKKKGSQKSSLMDPVNDYLLWYGRTPRADKVMKFRALFESREFDSETLAEFRLAECEDGSVFSLSKGRAPDGTAIDYREAPERFRQDYPSARVFRPWPVTNGGFRTNQMDPIAFEGRPIPPPNGRCWSYRSKPAGRERTPMNRLRDAGRLWASGTSLDGRRYLSDFALKTISNWWDGLGGAADPIYVVQTNARIVERCLLMTTEPGDLVLDPTCGSGTTAFVAEQHGRRWITIDTSRVAVALARQRLLTSKFDYYRLSDTSKGLAAGFVLKTVPRVSLRAIANNAALDPILDKHDPMLDEHLQSINQALADVTDDLRAQLAAKLAAKRRTEGKKAVTDVDRRRWVLPVKGQVFEHWTVPFDTDPDYPAPLATAVTAYRAAWRTKMDEVNAAIAANAEPEDLLDKPEVVSGIVRVSGPFTVEAVQPPEMSLGVTETPIGGEPEELDAGFEPEGAGDVATQNAEAYLDQMLRLLRVDGVRFPDNRQMEFTRLEPITGRSGAIHAEGRWHLKEESDPDPEGPPTVCVAFGPQYGPVTARQVEMLLRAASRRGYDDLVIAGFTFDGAAQAAIEDAEHPNVRIHMAHIRPDVNPGMTGLLKEQPGSQLFTVFGQPRTRLEGPDANGEYTVVMEGVDIYNPVDSSVTPTRADKVAAWFIDGDYDGRTFCITQAFFPDRDAWEKLAEALKGVIDEERFAAFSGTVSLPFPAGPNRAVAVKVIDPRGNEVMRLHRLENGHGG